MGIGVYTREHGKPIRILVSDGKDRSQWEVIDSFVLAIEHSTDGKEKIYDLIVTKKGLKLIKHEEYAETYKQPVPDNRAGNPQPPVRSEGINK